PRTRRPGSRRSWSSGWTWTTTRACASSPRRSRRTSGDVLPTEERPRMRAFGDGRRRAVTATQPLTWLVAVLSEGAGLEHRPINPLRPASGDFPTFDGRSPNSGRERAAVVSVLETITGPVF